MILIGEDEKTRFWPRYQSGKTQDQAKPCFCDWYHSHFLIPPIALSRDSISISDLDRHDTKTGMFPFRKALQLRLPAGVSIYLYINLSRFCLFQHPYKYCNKNILVSCLYCKAKTLKAVIIIKLLVGISLKPELPKESKVAIILSSHFFPRVEPSCTLPHDCTSIFFCI